ncbi:MAG: tetratricopeptide repeat protein [Saprospiraceae bacterium]|nr:tetratricopeptide repeat protein [Saprospiraceae bacterium]
MKNSTNKFPKKYLLYLFGILILAFVVYSNSINNDFIMGWDDEGQVVENDDIKTLSKENIKTIFTSFYVGMYQPISTLSYAVEYKISGLDAATNHRTSLFIHLINIILVFFLFYSFTKRIEISIIISLFFAIHPMNVESVSWISTRSNLMYSLFFLASLLSYVKYLQNKRVVSLILTFVFFVLSLLSKAPAITLPFVLILFDLYHSRKIDWKNILEKIPFIALSIVFVIIAYNAREEFSHIGSLRESFSFLDRVVFIGYSFVFYLVKLIVPVGLSAIHYYPVISTPNIESSVGWEYYFAAIVCIGIIVFTLKLIINAIKKKNFKDPLLFGILFYVITISVVVHFVPIGLQIVADRYPYISYLGFLFIIGTYFVKLKDSKKTARFTNITIGFLAIAVIIFSLITYNQNKKWENNETLLTDVIKKNPKVWHAYLVRADGYYWSGNYEKALKDYAIAIKSNPRYEIAYINRASVYAKQNKFQETITDLDYAIRLSHDHAEAYYNRGLAKFNIRDYNGAISDFDLAIALENNYPQAFLYRGNAKGLINQFDDAIKDFNKVLSFEPNNEKAYFSIGVANYKLRKYQEAISNYSKAIELKPDFSDAIMQRGVTLLMLKELVASCNDFRYAESLGNKKAAELVKKYCEVKMKASEMPQ